MTIHLENITKVVHGQTHIFETDLVLEDGSFNVFLGVTSSGKTSLMRLIAGLDRPTSGKVLADGKDVSRIPLQGRNIGMVYQEFINYPSYTVYDNIASPLRLKKLSKPEIDQRVREAAETLHLEPFLNRMPNELSGGQQQRLALARALVKNTNLLLLDEPLINLDYKLREELREELTEIIGTRDMIVVYATTETLEALILGGNTIILHEGKVLQSGPAQEVFHNPDSVQVALTFNNPPMNILHAKIIKAGRKGQALLADGTEIILNGYLKEIPEGDFQLGFRASQASVYKNDESDIPVDGIVDLAELSGSETFIHVQHHGVALVIHEKGTHPHKLGEKIRFYLKPQHLFAFDVGGKLIAPPPV
jgi:glycerol transport system ATP-binding protein